MDWSPARDGDPGTDPGASAIGALYTRYGRALLAHVLPWAGGDHEQAEDIVQETFLRAWQHHATLDSERAWPWLRTVARNLAVSAHRRTAARPQETDLGTHEPASDVDEFDRMLERWQMAEALRGLKPGHLSVLIEVYYRRHTIAEAAERLAIPPGTVKSRCYYALRALRIALEEKGVTGP